MIFYHLAVKNKWLVSYSDRNMAIKRALLECECYEQSIELIKDDGDKLVSDGRTSFMGVNVIFVEGYGVFLKSRNEVMKEYGIPEIYEENKNKA